MRINPKKIKKRTFIERMHISYTLKHAHIIKEPPANAVFKKNKLSEAKVALISTAGMVLKDEPGFDIKKGDPSFRLIPADTDYEDIKISHTHYDIKEAQKDLSVVFPLEILRRLKAEQFIGSLATHHFGLMGYIPQVEVLINETAPKIAQMLVDDDVDIALLSPG